MAVWEGEGEFGSLGTLSFISFKDRFFDLFCGDFELSFSLSLSADAFAGSPSSLSDEVKLLEDPSLSDESLLISTVPISTEGTSATGGAKGVGAAKN